jgi:hypothetical protein
MAAVISSIEPLIAVRKHLNNLTAISVDDLRIVWNLIKAELTRGNYLAARTHLLTAKAMTDRLGGLDKLQSMDSRLMKSLSV